ncbi:MAG: hypothetical protein AAF211_31180 [Myxococcota bacterium]
MWMIASLISLALADAPDYPDLQVAFHAGLLQPTLLRGFNAAADVRVGRFVASYSHGEGLDLTRVGLPAEQRAAGVQLRVPWTTGFGIGATLVDELYVLADFKVHRAEVDTGIDVRAYSTVTIGAEVGYRLFVWEGFYVSPVVRYWPNVWTSAPGGFAIETDAGTFQHDPIQQGARGLFANVLVGWAFDVRGERRSRTLFGSRKGKVTSR